jgi:predicted AAA+ superfamily ATPase
MWPLDFLEYLDFKGIDSTRIQNERLSPFLFTFYDLWKGHYQDFIRFGGFPEVVLAESPEDKEYYLKDLLNAYIELDIKLLSDFSVSDTLYKLILLLANRVGSRLDYSKLSSLTGINRHKIKDYLHLLEYTYIIRTVTPYTGGIAKEISKQPKLYFTDTGLLQACGQLSSGAIFENAIANQLAQFGKIQYFEQSAGTEIDFILDRQTAYEVKETCSFYDLNILTERAKLLGITDVKLIGRHMPESGFKDFIWGGNIF